MLSSTTRSGDPVVCEKCKRPSTGKDMPTLIMVGLETEDRGNFKTWAQAQAAVRWVCEPCLYRAVMGRK